KNTHTLIVVYKNPEWDITLKLKPMKVSLLFLVAFAAVASGATIPADQVFLQKQQDVLQLFHRIQQHSLIERQITEGNNYDVEAHIGNYEHPRVVKNFMGMYKKGYMLKRGEVFSAYYVKHREQAVMLFDLFFFAKDYDTFYKTACWARDRVNEGMFLYSFSIAVLHRQDTHDIVLPPLYEVYPYLFVENDIIQKAYEYRMQDAANVKEHHTHVIYQNFTLHNQEDELAYFREDVFLNAFNAYYRYLYPTWFNYTKYGVTVERPGEQFYYMNSQLYKRYMAERYSNDLPPIKPFEYEKPFRTPYNPKLRYHNGEEVPARPDNIYPTDFDLFYLSDIKNYERRVSDAVDFGYVFCDKLQSHSIYHDEKGFEMFAQIIEGNSIYPEFYGMLFHVYRSMLGHIVDPYHTQDEAPSALEQPEAALRDPAFYQLWKRVQHYFDEYQNRLPHYTREELAFDGVKIDNVDVGKLYTYFEPYEIGLEAAVHVGKVEEVPNVDIRLRNYRLNHKPFTYNIEMTSDKDAQAYVRVFMAPKYDYLGHEYDLSERKKHFFEIDRFPYHVKVGKNVVERKSHESSVVAHEDSYRVLYKKIAEAKEGKSAYEVDKLHSYCGLPEHLLIPKGKKGGQAYSFYVIVTPYHEEVKQTDGYFRAFSYCGVGPNNHYPDKKPLEFPFDRPLNSWDFITPNMYFKDVFIFHKNAMCVVAMKVSLLFLVAFAAVASGATIPADQVFLQKQQDVLQLFHRIQQHSLIERQVTEGNNYDVEAHIGDYEHSRVVKNFMGMYKKGYMLKRGEPFSVYYVKHKEQAVMLFDLFYFAKDYDTFYKTACWARDRVNEGMFLYSFSIAVLHRQDTHDIVLPPLYEVYPYLFVENDIIQKAYEYRMQAKDKEHHTHVIYQNFTLHNQEDELAYFREDVFLNAFNAYYRYLYPTWFNYTKYGVTVERPGEQFYYMNSQLYKRYMAERYSNDLPPIKPFEYEKPFRTPYNPKLRYHNGYEVPARPDNVYPTNFDLFYLSDIKNYEHRVSDAVDFGYVFCDKLQSHNIYHDEKGFEMLAQIIEGNSIYPEFYGMLFHAYRSMLGHIVDPYHTQDEAPSALEQPEAALRDPAFYQLWKRVQHYFDKYQNRLPHYTREELAFDGVKIDNVDVGKLYTYFEPYEIGLEAAVHVGKVEEVPNVDIRLRNYRLNHKPFTYNIEMTSDKDAQAYVRVFMAPKYDYLGHEYDLSERRKHFFEIDRFAYHVKVGKNVIERKSHESSVVAHEEDSYRVLYKKIAEAKEGKGAYEVDKLHSYCGLPEHLLIPKGKKGGQAYSFYVIVTPYHEEVKQTGGYFRAFSYCGVGPNNHYPDKKPLEFPFDRPLNSWDFVTPNMYFKDVFIFHKKYEEVEAH
ncbi:hypothetical protein L9F63_008525, partial [Diploptera punctata]